MSAGVAYISSSSWCKTPHRAVSLLILTSTKYIVRLGQGIPVGYLLAKEPQVEFPKSWLNFQS
jgi:hypothetical protein